MKTVRSGSRAAGVKVMLVAVQLNAPLTAGLMAKPPCAEAWRTGSEKSTTMLLVVSACSASPVRCCVTEMPTTVGPRASTVEA